MRQLHSNTHETSPTNRYKHGRQVYGFENPREVTIVCNQDTFFMNRIPGLEISAGLVLLNGIPILVDGSLSIPRTSHVRHTPGDGQRGTIEVFCGNKI